MTAYKDVFNARTPLEGAHETTHYFRLSALEQHDVQNLDHLPFTVRIILENLLRHADGDLIKTEDVLSLANWTPGKATGNEAEYPFLPGRVLLQDFTGVPAVADLAAMRSAVARMQGNPEKINPLVPADLVIDHSVQVDAFGSRMAFAQNVEREYERNSERYALLRWAQQAFSNFRVVPPGTGIVHQVNLEYLASVVMMKEDDGMQVAYPDTLVGTDSHTTMINGLGVLGWGVGGIEAEAVLLGQPLYLLTPEVIGMRLTGALPEGATATDLVLTVTQILRKRGVVGKFVEFTGPGLSYLALADRATISNMSPEFGATATLFPVDAETIRYLRDTGRDPKLVDLVERYTKAQGLFRTDETPEPQFDDLLELDLSTIEPSLAGPRRPQDRVAMQSLGTAFRNAYADRFKAAATNVTVESPINRLGNEGGIATPSSVEQKEDAESQLANGNGNGHSVLEGKDILVNLDGQQTHLRHGSVAIAAITSCTNTSNPSVMVAAGLLAKRAVEKGLKVNPAVKTSLAPGSRAVIDYLRNADLLSSLEELRFNLVGYGCTTCIGNSGPLPEPVAEAVQENDLVVAAVLSGNRNFEGRIHPQVRASFLASPPLVVAYALAGTVDIDLAHEPLGTNDKGEQVYLRDIWPSQEEIRQLVTKSVTPEVYAENYSRVFEGDEQWQALSNSTGQLFEWDPESTYVREPPFFQNMSDQPTPVKDIHNARVLAVLDDSITTDHISPAGSFAPNSPAGQYLLEHGVQRRDFNTYGARRGNHEVMMRGTFGNIRLRNRLTNGKEGYYTVHLPDGEETTIYDASMRYQQEGTPLLIIAGKEYGSGSSRDWAAKGPLLLGVLAVIAESFERIHRSNLVGMGILPLQFRSGESKESLGLTGHETYDILGIEQNLKPRQTVTVKATREDGSTFTFETVARLDSAIDVTYYKNGGILLTVLRRLAQD
ncbi:aconitate hydratase AcnA [Ktedonobacter racemifer]|uniref:Aconitate hydratase n=1 Tax=Ktedonobacter racemifer DSM 44963 TaxID=485913 RepID=D6TLM7_KTERA|nr:aconitate hydratase AcnA [Ktedonobacter racemifer]EFH86677.1 aconitate hydratase 1 [Ktedonobacter racemifer DSM 44963]